MLPSNFPMRTESESSQVSHVRVPVKYSRFRLEMLTTSLPKESSLNVKIVLCSREEYTSADSSLPRKPARFDFIAFQPVFLRCQLGAYKGALWHRKLTVGIGSLVLGKLFFRTMS